MVLNDVEDNGTFLIFKIPDTKTHIPRTFTVTSGVDFFRKYIALRQKDTPHRRLFVCYRKGKCTVQPVGINTFGKIPTKIAEYLKLPNPAMYTGHCFRRTSATLLVNAGADILTLKKHGGWKSSTVAEGYIDDSIQNKVNISKKIASEIFHPFNLPSTPRTNETWEINNQCESEAVTDSATVSSISNSLTNNLLKTNLPGITIGNCNSCTFNIKINN